MKLSSHDLAQLLASMRDNDVKFEINGIAVPVGGCFYHSNSDTVMIVPDYDSEDYRIAVAPEVGQ
ncbi:MAG: hypothetical protein ABWX96_13600 [Propionibacteriaceae bacterium]